jgi:prepilin-type N-terminal cleavage/methylation domain-containing protein
VNHPSTSDLTSPDRPEAGFTLIEMIIAVAVLMIVSASVFTGVQNLTKTSDTVQNRSEMHAGVRNATELLQQEVGQAGKISLPGTGTVTMTVGVAAPSDTIPQPVVLSSVAGMFVGQTLSIDAGPNEESVQVTAINTGANTVTGLFKNVHPATAPVRVEGGFFAGVVPTNYLNGSTPSVLKIFGDINSDGNMVYIEYTCDTAAGNLYRNSMSVTAGAKIAPDISQVLLSNIQTNPGGAPCFTYQQATVSGLTFVTDVAITLTVHTEKRDPLTGLFQTETKALLNVSPRNVFNVWQLASLNMTNRVQSVPASVTNLLP